jgi:hypothetical protein
MLPTLYIMTDALLCKTIAENPLMSAQERVTWIESHISRIVPEERDMYIDLVLKRMEKMSQVKVD